MDEQAAIDELAAHTSAEIIWGLGAGLG
jgi:hypothetical protein